MHPQSNHNSSRLWAGSVAIAAILSIAPAAAAVNVVLQMRNGDRITGELITQETNRVVIATSWAGTLALPIEAIGGLKSVSGETIAVTTPPPAPTPATSKATTPIAAATTTKPKPVTPAVPQKRLHTNVQVGSNLAFGARDSQTLFTRVKSTYEKPYARDAKKFFRTTADFATDYGKTEGVESANRMNGGLKADFDLGQRSYAYTAASIGYDEVRQIDLQYEIGPGMGFHLVTKPSLTLNVESGLNYQAQKRSTGEDVESVYLRLGEDTTWKLGPRLSLSKKFEFFLDGEDAQKFRFRLDSNLSYKLIENLSLNLTVLDLFDTHPVANVNKNELQIRSSIGITF